MCVRVCLCVCVCVCVFVFVFVVVCVSLYITPLMLQVLPNADVSSLQRLPVYASQGPRG